MSFIEELEWRGMLKDSMPGIEEHLNESMRAAYVGIDPTADSLHIGHLVSIMMLKHFQEAGHKPIALVGGATGMIGDPSGKSQERNLLDEKTLRHNAACIKSQLERFLDFDSRPKNGAELVNNYDWMKEFSFIEFIRDIGKHITVNYMMAKDSVKKRLSGESQDGMSFTEFTYQLVQGYDFLHLYRDKSCTIQMGGSDQWGNITTGTELIRRIAQGKAFAVTCPLITKADGGKFGKTESGNIWLDAKRTSPYKFYQFWLNTTDADAEKYIKIFTLLDKETIDKLIEEHRAEPHLRKLQKALAEDLTVRVHSQEALESAQKISAIVFNKKLKKESLEELSAEEFAMIADGLPSFYLEKTAVDEGIAVARIFSQPKADEGEEAPAKKEFGSKTIKSSSDVRRSIKANSLAVNTEKVKSHEQIISNSDLLHGRYIFFQNGKSDKFIAIVKE